MEIRTVLGIDVSKSTSNVAILVNSQPVDDFKINNDAIGFAQLNHVIHQCNAPEVIFEATGVYSRRLAYFLQTNEIPYVQLNPLQAKKEIDGLRQNKTDKNDAFHLAETQFRLNRQKTLIKNPVYSELMDESRFYQEQIHDFVSEKNRLHRILQITFPEIEQVMSNPTGITYWNLVTEFPIPSEVNKFNLDQLTEIVLECANNHIGKLKARETANKLMDFSNKAVSSVSSSSLDIKQVKFHAFRLMEIEKMKKEIIKSMATLAKALPEFDVLQSIPGIGEESAVSIIAELGDIRRFRTPNQVNAYIGIDLRHYESGNYTASDRISKRGNPYARKILYRTVMNMVSISRYQSNHINDYYQKKKQSSQGTKKIAIASMSRLIRTIHHIVLKNETYDYKIASHAIH